MHDFEHDRQDNGPVRQPVDRHEEAIRFAPGRPHDAGSVLRLQRTAGNAAVTEMLQRDEEESPVHGVIGRGGGQALDDGTRATMEGAFGADFGSVRVHTDAAASDSAKTVQAHAYTVGENVVFQSGNYSPGSDSGKRMLAHELTHVVQQRSGPVDGTPASGGIKVSDPSDRFEREAATTAERAVAGPASAAPATAPAQLQRQADGDEPEEEPVQRSFVQRQEELEGEPED